MAGYEPYDDTTNNDNTQDVSNDFAQGGDESQQVSNAIASYSNPTPQMSVDPKGGLVGEASPYPQMSYAPTPAGSIGNVTTQGPADGQDAQSQAEGKPEYDPHKVISDSIDITDKMLGLSDLSETISATQNGINAMTQGDISGSGTNTKTESTEFFSTLMKGILNKDNAGIVNLGANLIAGMFNQKYKNAASDAATKNAESSRISAEAGALNAKTAQRAQEQKEIGARAIGLIDMPQAPIKYQNLLAERRTRSGAK
jgi:hypothetical protein